MWGMSMQKQNIIENEKEALSNWPVMFLTPHLKYLKVNSG